MNNTNFDILLDRIKWNMGNNKLSHAFNIYGSDGSSRKKFAKEAVKLILNGDEKTNRKIDEENHEDLLIVKKDGESIKVPQIELLIASLKNKPFSCDIMVTIIEDGDCITEHSQNKLLKTLEEPSAGYVIFILVSNPELLTQTIRSRCVQIKLMGEGTPVDDKCHADAKSILSMALFQEVAMNDVFIEISNYEDRYVELLNAMKSFLRDIVVGYRNESLISNTDNLSIINKISNSNEGRCRRCINIVEEASVKLTRGANDKNTSKYILRDMAVRIRQEAKNG